MAEVTSAPRSSTYPLSIKCEIMRRPIYCDTHSIRGDFDFSCPNFIFKQGTPICNLSTGGRCEVYKSASVLVELLQQREEKFRKQL